MNEEDETLKLLESMQQEIAYLRGRVNALETERQMHCLLYTSRCV